ncbi:DUF2537 domain-containing protein [Actinomycetospora cinnamomea]|uniref:Uncharacterized protein DUF2537 n=1 Tax=Actinomycetospora cinnamomea TaxID=663609 RepID=A0A2U1FM49_9PSEU|nr:DUF2537 domain-containing protein [Actinomycetospora cinnamomea]PVZ13216.1 uncharacterized protein DUF2537 [Actinomycetospora cinnamomea]
MRVVELRAVRGHAMVAGVPLSDRTDGRTWGLPTDLVDALQEWARVAASVGPFAAVPGARPAPPDAAAEAVSRRGRQLAARLSVELAVPVDYCDPVTGHRVALRAVTRTPHPPPVPPLPVRFVDHGPPHPGDTGTPSPVAAAAEPTPWGTGLVLAVLVAGLVLLANLALAAPLITGLGPLGLLVDAAVVAGLVPALWLNRHVPTWRWAVYGTFAGTGVAFLFLAVAAF